MCPYRKGLTCSMCGVVGEFKIHFGNNIKIVNCPITAEKLINAESNRINSLVRQQVLNIIKKELQSRDD